MAEQVNLRQCKSKPRVVVLSDISNEPDDAESLVRFLLYANEFDVRGLVACTSTWMRSVVHPEDVQEIVNAYGQVIDNLNAHVHAENQYPTAEYLLSITKSGPPVYGRKVFDPEVPLSQGTALLIEQLSASDEPLWVLCWGGTNVLAQALHHLQQSTSASEFTLLRSKLRVYAISDQDDTGLWIRTTHPDIFYICSIHGWNQYQNATWIGISGDVLAEFDSGGPDLSKLTRSWLKENIQIGPLGAVYPDYKFIIEGDTPTFLYLIQNGLGSPEHPEWGSWGGRYNPVDLSLAAKHYSDASDNVIGKDGKKHSSNRATIWRWRDAYQNDFAARMQWTLTSDRSRANHAPVVMVNGSTAGPEPLFLSAEAGSTVALDASGSYDPDGDELSFLWFQYKEATAGSTSLVEPQIPNISINNIDASGRKINLTIPPPEKCAIDFLSGEPQAEGQVFHIILQVSDNGTPSLTTYKRIVVQVTNRELKGGRDKKVDTVTDYLDLK